MAIGVSGFCRCWIERLRRWLGGRLTTNINIDNTEGHWVPHPVRTNKLSLVPHGLAHVHLRRPCIYLHRYTLLNTVAMPPYAECSSRAAEWGAMAGMASHLLLEATKKS